MEPMSIPRILAQTLRIPIKSPKLAVLLVLVYLSATTLLFTTNFYVLLHDVRPLLGYIFHDLLIVEESDDGPKAEPVVDAAEQDAMKDAVQVFKKEFLFWVASYLVSVCSWIVTVHFTEITHLGKLVSLKDLLSRALASLKGTLVTCLLASLMVFAYVVALLLPLGLLMHVLHKARALVFLALALLVIPGILSVLFLSFLCDLARVVSVLEGCYGPTAFAKAWEILKERRLQGFFLTLVLLVAAFVALEPLNLVEITLLKREALWAVVSMGYVKVNVVGLLTIFSMMAFAVFYLDCKRYYGERTASVGVELQFDKLVSDDLSDEEGLLP